MLSSTKAKTNLMDKEALISIVQGVQNGDEKAATQMYNAFHEGIYFYIYKIVNDSELAADLTQDTFIEILQSIRSLKEPVAFVSWSRQIAYRRCTAFFKKRRDIIADEDEDGYSVFDTVEDDYVEFIPEEALDKEDFKQTVRRIISELPDEQRAAILMRYFEEMPVEEIANVQGVSVGTVKSRLNYGRKAIKKAVEDYEKKYDVKLHGMGIIPILLWMLREQRSASGLSIVSGAKKTAFAATSAEAAATTATAATTAGTTAGAASAAATGAISAGAAKSVGAAFIVKVVSVIAAATVAVTGAALGINHLVNAPEDTEETEAKEEKSSSINSPCRHVSTNGILTTYPSEISTVCSYDVSLESGAIAVMQDMFCKECEDMWVDINTGSEDCEHEWSKESVETPKVSYTRGACNKCGMYAILDHEVNPCDHKWDHDETKSVCALCGFACDHDFGKPFKVWLAGQKPQYLYCFCYGCNLHIDRDNTQTAENLCAHQDKIFSEREEVSDGVEKILYRCEKCKKAKINYTLTYSDQPIYDDMGVGLASEYITETSYGSMDYVLRALQSGTGDVKCTPVGTRYYYNEESDQSGLVNNRLVVVFHVENGVVPGGWYTYLEMGGDVVIKSVKNSDGTFYHSTVIARRYNEFDGLPPHETYYNSESNLLMGTAPYQTTFEYGGVTYTGHTTVEDCLKALEINWLESQGYRFDHYVQRGEILS